VWWTGNRDRKETAGFGTAKPPGLQPGRPPATSLVLGSGDIFLHRDLSAHQLDIEKFLIGNPDRFYQFAVEK